MLFALGQPVAFAGLLLAFLLGLLLRAYAIRITAKALKLVDGREPIHPRLRDDIDPFGAVAAAVGGVGWGKVVNVDEVPRWRGRGRAAAVFAAGPVAILVASQLFLLAVTLTSQATYVWGFGAVTVVMAGQAPGEPVDVFLLSTGVGLLEFGLLALVPIPPLDGFGILWNAVRRPGPALHWMRLWLEDKNVGVVILLLLSFFPLGNPILRWPLDMIGMLLLRPWG